jgi:hypothetical protein
MSCALQMGAVLDVIVHPLNSMPFFCPSRRFPSLINLCGIFVLAILTIEQVVRRKSERDASGFLIWQ